MTRAVLCGVPVPGGRRLIGLFTLAVLVAIGLGVSGVNLPGLGPGEPPLPGVRAIAASTLIHVGTTAPPGAELAFMAVEPSGNLLVSDARRRVVMRFDSTGHQLSEWGPRFGSITLDQPAGVAVQGDNYYVLDRGTPRLFRLDGSGQVQAMFDLQPFGPYGLNGLLVDPSGNLYVADTGRNRLLVLSPAGGLVRTIGRPGADVGGLTQPMMAAFGPDGSLFVADWENDRIARWNAQLEAVDAWSVGYRPFGVAVDQEGRVFAPDAERRRVVAYSPRGAVLGEFAASGVAAIDVAPRQVAIINGARSSLYVLGNDGIQRLDLENTTAPPQSTGDPDVISILVIASLVLVLVLAVWTRRTRRQIEPALLAATADRPVRLDTEDGAEPEHEKAKTDQDLLVANQPERE
jgi:sugar lactone lactonase YvrE